MGVSGFLLASRSPRRPHNSAQRARCSSALRPQILELGEAAVRDFGSREGGDAGGRLSIGSIFSDRTIVISFGASCSGPAAAVGGSRTSSRSALSSPVPAEGDKGAAWSMNTRRVSSSWQEGQLKMWCSNPGTSNASSRTARTRRISSPHSMQRMDQTRAVGRGIERRHWLFVKRDRGAWLTPPGTGSTWPRRTHGRISPSIHRHPAYLDRPGPFLDFARDEFLQIFRRTTLA